MRSLFLAALFVSSCATVNMQAGDTESVKCNFKVPAPFLIKCTSSAGKEFTWSGPMALTIEGICPPCDDGSCPACPVKP